MTKDLARFQWHPVNTTASNVEYVRTNFVFHKGQKGKEVKALQAALKALGIPTKVDGVYGPATEKSVVAFQRSAGLAPGLAGPQTSTALYAALASATVNAAAKVKQAPKESPASQQSLKQLAEVQAAHSEIASITGPISATDVAQANTTLSNIQASQGNVAAKLNSPDALSEVVVPPKTATPQSEDLKIESGNAAEGYGDGYGHGLIASPYHKDNPAKNWPWGVAALGCALAFALVKKSVVSRF